MAHARAFIAPLILSALAWALDLTRLAGAHPWWSGNVVLLGAPLGIALGLVLVFVAKPRTALILCCIGAATGLAVSALGKARFAASFAEDVLAGRMWYLGWIATCALVSAAVLAAAWPRPGAR